MCGSIAFLSVYNYLMRTQTLHKEQDIFSRPHNPRRHQKQLTYKLRSYLPQIKTTGRENNLLNITKETLNKHQMLYLDFYEGSGVRILQKSPEQEGLEEDENQTFGKVRVMELNNLSDSCKKTLNYFSASKDQRLKRDLVRRSIFSKLHSVDRTKETITQDQKPVNRNEHSSSLTKKVFLNVAERNRRLPKKEKYLIQKFGIVTGEHMFKVDSKNSFSVVVSAPQTQREERSISPLRPIFSMRHPKEDSLASKLKQKNATFYHGKEGDEAGKLFENPRGQTLKVGEK